MAENAFIHIAGLTKDFKHKRALDQIDLSVDQGALFGLVGPDGAGKTTLLRTLAGLLSITSGEVQAAGCDLAKDPETIKGRIGYMAQEFSLYGSLSVKENLRFFADLYDVPPAAQAERLPGLLAFAQLVQFQDRRAAKLSGGMKKKLALACTLIHRPPLLLLDEPTTGVDPVSRREFWNILNDLHLQGTTIIVSTPYMDEADRCSRVALMYRGKIINCAPPAGLRNQLQGELLKVLTSDWQEARRILRALPGVREIQSYGEALHVLVDSASARAGSIQASLNEHGLTVKEIRQISPRMEETFISLIRGLEGGS